MAVQGKELFADRSGQLYLVTRSRDGEYSVHRLTGQYVQTFHHKHRAVNAITNGLLDEGTPR